MSDFILRNATEEELGRAVEENVFAMMQDMARVLHGELGYSPYLKLGFKDTGRRVSRYLWTSGSGTRSL